MLFAWAHITLKLKGPFGTTAEVETNRGVCVPK